MFVNKVDHFKVCNPTCMLAGCELFLFSCLVLSPAKQHPQDSWDAQDKLFTMGQGKSQFTDEELQDYEDLTYFTKKEVLHAHQKFKALAPEKVGHNKNAKLPMQKMLQYPELNVNPFGDRICIVFSSSNDGDCTFEDFLDMMSVFSATAPKAVKAEHAFRIFDFDGDDMLGANDLRQVIDRLINTHKLSEHEMEHLIRNILEEADLDDDGALSFAEFEHIIDKSSDFSSTFRIRL